MRIYDFSKKKKGNAGFFVTMTEKEALQTIRSLSSQLLSKNPNSERLESYITWTDGEIVKNDLYFTISVNDWLLGEVEKEIKNK
jgi:hypothetical protein